MARTSGGLVLAKVASTGPGGFTLQNGTPTIRSWTAPNDGNLHPVFIAGYIMCSVTQVGGEIQIFSNGTGFYQGVLDGGNHGGGPKPINLSGGQNVSWIDVAMQPGAVFSIGQTIAMTSGAATVYLDIWSA